MGWVVVVVVVVAAVAAAAAAAAADTFRGGWGARTVWLVPGAATYQAIADTASQAPADLSYLC